MATNIDHVNNYSPTEGDILFFDANVWLAIYGPSPKFWAQAPCSDLYYKLIKNNIPIYTNCLIISEIINSWARLEFKQQRKSLGYEQNEYKLFRETPQFKSVAKEISITVDKILRWSKRIDSNLESIDMENIISKYESGHHDFNDLVFGNICENNAFIFVTNDSDFCTENMDILTANKFMIKN
ncbi:PIN domain-containing protein [Methanococcoides methylutens]|uniref:PIN domain-containing protein n=1 Tax=Methanococcoides methylutens MM1 TaxID=1434104 RepID=A0A0E3SQ71_METMT|nr:PIN domain-containing protein [Methanococcoides methylutens]AKB84102.1 hypothetical protein MCMEM_0049 [Methanococcoides methylutens MM1]